MTPLQNHPAADTFPMMEGVRFDELKADIQAQGQLEPITVCDGMILDGRNRYRACIVLGIEPKTRTYEGNPWAYAWSLNGNRRDLADMQRAACKILCDKGSEEYAKRNKERKTAISNEANEKRRVAALEGRVGRASKKRDSLVVVQHEQQLNADRAKGMAARAREANVSSSTQARVESLANNRPDLLEKVASGEIKGAEALRQMKKDQVADKVAELPADKFSVIYADPPWSYNDKCGDAGVQSKQLGEHYPSMTMAELKALDVPFMAADNCVLWLWATCPLLEDALDLCKAWGFKYKAQFVWDKVKHNMGHYNSVRHELLLVCTKGSATPEKVKLFDSVQSIERTEHSRKPEEFRDIINTLYPSGKKIELFRRGDAPEGWQTWGNEA
jgi:N6-adenosine-specific RNA methylase IME4